MVNTHWDAIVVGTGVGGGTAASTLIQNNKRILLLDIGQGSSQSPIVMERFHESDTLEQGGRWPLSMKDWIPYFEDAEKIFNVKAATVSDDFKTFLTLLENKGIHPVPLNLSHLDAHSGALKKLDSRATILSVTDVTSVITDGERATGVKFIHEGQEKTHTADRIYLAAGALKTPSLLRNSESKNFPKGIGNRYDLLGTRLMRQFSDLYFIDWETSSRVNDHKSLGIYDFYVDPKTKKQVGIFQSFGSLPPADQMIAELTQNIPWVTYIPGSKKIFESYIQSLYSKHVMVSILEDSPLSSNRLIFNKEGKVRVHYEISPADYMKIEHSRAIAAKIFGKSLKKVQHQAENNKRLAHACGTCAMGASPQESVTDFNGRVHDLENLYIVDSSVFPSSTGKNPSLTIAANAIRVCERSLGIHR